MKRLGSTATPEQPEEIKQAIEKLYTEIENSGNKIFDDLEAFLARLEGSSDPADKAAAQTVLQRLQEFDIMSKAPEDASSSTVTASPASASSDQSASQQESSKQKVTSWLKRIVENAREDGPPKQTNPEPKA